MSKKRSYTVYRFNELSKEAKEKAIQRHYDREDYPWLYEDLKSQCEEALKKAKISIESDSLELSYSLSHCQGDGLSFTGYFTWRKWAVTIKRGTSNYSHRYSVNFNIENQEALDAPGLIYDKFRAIYYKICAVLEKQGYGIVDYYMDDIEFNEYCESNDCWFTKDGNID